MMQSKLMKTAVFGAALLMPTMKAMQTNVTSTGDKAGSTTPAGMTIVAVKDLDSKNVDNRMNGEFLETKEFVDTRLNGSAGSQVASTTIGDQDSERSAATVALEKKPESRSWFKKNWKKLAGVAGVAIGGTAGVFAGIDLANVGPGNDGSNVFTGHNINYGETSDGGWTCASLIGLGVAVGLTLIVASIMKYDKGDGCQNPVFWMTLFFAFSGSGVFMAGLNFIQTNTDLGTSITNGFTGMTDTAAADQVAHNHVVLSQILLIAGSSLLGLMLIFMAISLVTRCAKKAVVPQQDDLDF